MENCQQEFPSTLCVSELKRKQLQKSIYCHVCVTRAKVFFYRLQCRGTVPRLIKEPIDLTTEHLLQLDMEMNGEHTKLLMPWMVYLLYIFCLVQGTVALLLSCHYALDMGREMNLIWLRLFGKAILQHMLGFEMIKLILLVTSSTLLHRDWVSIT